MDNHRVAIVDSVVHSIVIENSALHKVLIYIEHHSVCPLVGIGTPPPL